MTFNFVLLVNTISFCLCMLFIELSSLLQGEEATSAKRKVAEPKGIKKVSPG